MGARSERLGLESELVSDASPPRGMVGPTA